MKKVFYPLACLALLISMPACKDKKSMHHSNKSVTTTTLGATKLDTPTEMVQDNVTTTKTKKIKTLKVKKVKASKPAKIKKAKAHKVKKVKIYKVKKETSYN